MKSVRFRLVIRFVIALHELAGEAGNPWRRANDIARYDGMPLGKLDVVLAQATSAGLIERHADHPEMVALTAAGTTAVHGQVAR